MWDDDDARNFQLMVDRVHEHGALAGVQLGFNGNGSENLDTRMCARGVEQVPSDTFVFHSCYAMTKREIRELQSFYVTAALRAMRIGFDVINLSALTRTARSPSSSSCRATTTEPTSTAPSRWPTGRGSWWRHGADPGGGSRRVCRHVRLSIDTIDPSGRGISADIDAPEIVSAADHLVDLWDFEVCGPTMAEWGDGASPSRFFKEGYQLPYVAKVRPYTKKPVVNVGRWVHPDAMRGGHRDGARSI